MKTYTTTDDFLADLSPERRSQVEAICTIIKTTSPELSEHIKWNSPSYVLDGEDRITLNAHYPDRIVVVIHMGGTRKEDKKGIPVLQDTSELIKWSSDIRGAISFESADDIEEKRDAFVSIIQRWLKIPV